jgi:hypothetical protein
MTANKQPKKDLAALLAEEGEAAEANPDAPITEATTFTRGHGRSKTLQIRLNPEELEELERTAASRGLPTSTVAREAILRLIRPAELRSADGRRLVEGFARYVDSLAAVPIAVPVVAARSTTAPARPTGESFEKGVATGQFLVSPLEGRLATMDAAFPEAYAAASRSVHQQHQPGAPATQLEVSHLMTMLRLVAELTAELADRAAAYEPREEPTSGVRSGG